MAGDIAVTFARAETIHTNSQHYFDGPSYHWGITYIVNLKRHRVCKPLL